MRARELGIEIGEGSPGRRNAITDVEGVLVGHTTLVEGDAIRTGVTVVVPPQLPLFAGCHRLNGNGELTGLEWVRESGLLTTPIGITNTFSVGVVRDAIAARSADGDSWSLPVVGETYDGPQRREGPARDRGARACCARERASRRRGRGKRRRRHRDDLPRFQGWHR